MQTEKAKIALYKTRDSGFSLFKQNLETLIKAERLDMDVIGLSPEEIKHRALYRDDIIGLVMPGRTHGQDYRDELGDDGSEMIQKITNRAGLSVLAVCAGSYMLSQHVHWQNDHDPSNNKTVENKFPLFHGSAVGAFNTLWQDGYKTRRNDESALPGMSSVLAAKVIDIEYSTLLTGEADPLYGSSVYLGGGAFIADPGFDQNIQSLIMHKKTKISVRHAIPKHRDLFTPEAVIEFDAGLGKVIFSNIHPEIDAKTFTASFKNTHQALMNARDFARDTERLTVSKPHQTLVFRRFLDNCVKNPRGTQKQLALGVPTR